MLDATMRPSRGNSQHYCDLPADEVVTAEPAPARHLTLAIRSALA